MEFLIEKQWLLERSHWDTMGQRTMIFPHQSVKYGIICVLTVFLEQLVGGLVVGLQMRRWENDYQNDTVTIEILYHLRLKMFKQCTHVRCDMVGGLWDSWICGVESQNMSNMLFMSLAGTLVAWIHVTGEGHVLEEHGMSVYLLDSGRCAGPELHTLVPWARSMCFLSWI